MVFGCFPKYVVYFGHLNIMNKMSLVLHSKEYYMCAVTSFKPLNQIIFPKMYSGKNKHRYLDTGKYILFEYVN